MTLFAAELLKELKPFIEEGVSPQVIMAGVRRAASLVGPLLIAVYSCRRSTRSRKLPCRCRVRMKSSFANCWRNVLLLPCLPN